MNVSQTPTTSQPNPNIVPVIFDSLNGLNDSADVINLDGTPFDNIPSNIGVAPVTKPKAVMNEQAIREFIKSRGTDNFLNLTAIPPDGKPVSRTFDLVARHQRAKAVKWIKKHNNDGYNIYFTVNAVIELITKKPTKADIVACLYLHADIDPKRVNDYEAEQIEILKLVDPLKSSNPNPWLIIYSGNGLQVFYKIKTSTTDFTAVEELNKRLIALHGGDAGTHNIDRLMRLPGTLNYPNKRKIAKGYPSTPSLANVLYIGTEAYEIEELQALLPEIQTSGAVVVADVEFNEDETPLNEDEIATLKIKFQDFKNSRPKLKNRWEGSAEGLNDSSRSGRDISIMAMLARVFNYRESRYTLTKFSHGKGAECAASGDERYFRNIWVKVVEGMSTNSVPLVKEKLTGAEKHEDVKKIISEAKLTKLQLDEVINYVVENKIAGIDSKRSLKQDLKEWDEIQVKKSVAAIRGFENAPDVNSELGFSMAMHSSMVGKFAFNPAINHWMECVTGIWKKDNEGLVGRHIHSALNEAEDIARKMYAAGDVEGASEMTKAINKLKSGRGIESMKRLLRDMESMVVDGDAFDNNPLLVGLPDGRVFDLETVEPRDGKSSDMVSKTLAVTYDENATCPMFIETLDTTFGGNKNHIRFIQTVVGSALSGRPELQKLIHLEQEGGGGKSTILTTIGSLMHDYRVTVNITSLMGSRAAGSGSSDLARINKARFMLTTELPEDAHLNEALIKGLTGGDYMTAAHKFQDEIEFISTALVITFGNYPFQYKGTDKGIIRRVINVECQSREFIANQNLPELLRSEHAGILNWMLEGWARLKREGLNIPDDVAESSARLAADNDLLGQWFKDRCELTPEGQESQVDLTANCKWWLECHGYPKNVTSRKIGDYLRKKKGVSTKHERTGNVVHGLRIVK